MPGSMIKQTNKIRVILVADTKAHNLFRCKLGEDCGFKVELKTCNYNEALKAAETFKNPVVVLLVKDPDIVKKFAQNLNEQRIKYICICRNAKDGFDMLACGASDMITYDEKHFINNLNEIERILSIKIKSIYNQYISGDRRTLKAQYGGFNRIIAIGSSTGGTEVILSILQKLPADAPPILITQHMPPVFTRLYAERIHEACRISVWEAQNGDELKCGLALLAPGGLQMTLEKENGVYRVRCQHGALVSGHCPSVDVLFRSVAEAAGDLAIGVILTGMGKDGADGLLKMRAAGAMTFGQDEESCVVYGMPKEAYNIGAVVKQLPANKIAEAVMAICTGTE